MTNPQNPGDQEQPTPYPSAPPPPPNQGSYGAPPPQGQYPAPPLGAYPTADVSQPRPKDIETSFMLWVGAIALGVVSIILGFLFVDDAALAEARTQLEAQGSAITQDQLDTVVLVGKVIAAVLFAIIYGLWLMFVFFMRSGKGWARIVLAVLTGLWLIFALIGLAGQPALLLIVQILQIAAVIGATVFMFRPAANAYFNRPAVS